MKGKRTLTKEQQELYDALTDLQKRCVDIKVKNPTMSNGECYRVAKNIDVTDCSAFRHSRRYAFHVFSQPAVKAFQRSIEVETLDDMIMSREQILIDSSDIAETTIADVMTLINENDTLMNVDNGEMINAGNTVLVKRMEDIPSHVWKAVKKMKPGKYGIEIELFDTVAARKMVNEMQGYNAPIKQELVVEPKSLDDFYGDA